MNIPHLPALRLRPSPRLAAILVAAHLAALGLLITLTVAFWMLALAAAVLALSAVISVSRHAWLRGRRSVLVLEFSNREQVHVRLRDGSAHGGRILGSSTVGAALTVLNIQLDDQRFPVYAVIMNDSLDPEDFRRLRVWLRWGPHPQADEAAVP